MNTPDTEWEKEKFNELLTLVKRGHEAVINEEEIEEYDGELRTFITSLRTSRDTYWKERVEKLWGMLDDIDSVPDMLHPNTERGHESTWKMMVAIAEKRHKILKTDGFTLTPITNEDNLK